MAPTTPFADLALALRLERAEGLGNAGFVDTRELLEPGTGACWAAFGGALAMFDGPISPLTQTFGLGLESAVDDAELDAIEAFFRTRGARVHHEVSPLAGVDLYARLHARGYTPIEASSVLYRPLAPGAGLERPTPDGVRVRRAVADDAELYTRTSLRGWTEFPELHSFIEGIGRVSLAQPGVLCFLAEVEGEPVATGALSHAGGVALMAGASTVPEGRRQGAQLALLDARLRAAVAAGCDLAMMCALPGSASQRNAERHGFRVAYTRVKWALE